MNASRRATLVKAVTFVLALVPMIKLGVDALLGRLGVDPVSEIENRLGWWTLVMLLATLAVTPLNAWLRWTWPLRLRRMIGLFAFFYATVHFASYLAIDQGLDFSAMLDDVVKRKFITVGFAAWTLLVPLAITSTNGWRKRLGQKRWQALHRLVYLVVVLGLFHFAWRFKVLEDAPLVFAGIFALLMLARVAHGFVKRSRARARASREANALGVPIR